MTTNLLDQLIRADDAGVKLEIVRGLHLWEAMPAPRHQRAIDRIRATLTKIASDQSPTNCGCFHLADVYVRFPDGSIKRPDISVFCQEPPENDEAITQIPEAVIEIVSPGYEDKDLEIGPPFYLSQGVKDVVVFDPRTLLVVHVRREKTTRQISPVTLTLECGCQCIV